MRHAEVGSRLPRLNVGEKIYAVDLIRLVQYDGNVAVDADGGSNVHKAGGYATDAKLMVLRLSRTH